jgi:hypothetical protein
MINTTARGRPQDERRSAVDVLVDVVVDVVVDGDGDGDDLTTELGKHGDEPRE